MYRGCLCFCVASTVVICRFCLMFVMCRIVVFFCMYVCVARNVLDVVMGCSCGMMPLLRRACFAIVLVLYVVLMCCGVGWCIPVHVLDVCVVCGCPHVCIVFVLRCF